MNKTSKKTTSESNLETPKIRHGYVKWFEKNGFDYLFLFRSPFISRAFASETHYINSLCFLDFSSVTYENFPATTNENIFKIRISHQTTKQKTFYNTEMLV